MSWDKVHEYAHTALGIWWCTTLQMCLPGMEIECEFQTNGESNKPTTGNCVFLTWGKWVLLWCCRDVYRQVSSVMDVFQGKSFIDKGKLYLFSFPDWTRIPNRTVKLTSFKWVPVIKIQALKEWIFFLQGSGILSSPGSRAFPIHHQTTCDG